MKKNNFYGLLLLVTTVAFPILLSLLSILILTVIEGNVDNIAAGGKIKINFSENEEKTNTGEIIKVINLSNAISRFRKNLDAISKKRVNSITPNFSEEVKKIIEEIF